MLLKIFLVGVFLNLSNGALSKDEGVKKREGVVMGLETQPNIRIDKDTVITHMKVGNKNAQDKAGPAVAGEDEPDWTYSSFPQEVSPHVQQFKKNMSECLKEVQANNKKTVQRLSPKMDSPVHGECLIACVLKRNDVIKNGKVNKDNLITLVSKFFAKNTKMMKKLEKNLDKCIEISSKSKDECSLASTLNDCTNNFLSHGEIKLLKNH